MQTLEELGSKIADALPNAEHVELDCGHVPQLERPRETHAAIARFFSAEG